VSNYKINEDDGLLVSPLPTPMDCINQSFVR